MIDWTSIPIHLRCTDREKIQAGYPGHARWWQQQESRASVKTIDRDPIFSRVPDSVAQWYISRDPDESPMDTEAIATECGLTLWQFHAAMKSYRVRGTSKASLSRSKHLPAILRELSKGESTGADLARVLGVSPNGITSVMNGLPSHAMVYEHGKPGSIRFGILEAAS